MTKTKKKNTVYFVQLALLTAVLALFAFTPLGKLKITPGVCATLAHIPVIIGAIVLGKWAGLYLGSMFGLFSFIDWTFMNPGDPYAPIFTPFAENAVMGSSLWSLVIVFVPRALFGLLTALIFSAFEKHTKLNNKVSATLSAIIGTVLHSLMVLSLTYFIFGSVYSKGKHLAAFIIAWAGVNCLLEIAVAAVVSAALAVPLRKITEA